MTNREVAWILNAMADMLELKNDNPYRVRAYRKAAHTVYHLDEDLRDVYLRNAVGEIPGIGSRMRDQIEEMLETGSCIFLSNSGRRYLKDYWICCQFPVWGTKLLEIYTRDWV